MWMPTNLLARLLKHLAAMRSIYETGSNEYVSTPFSSALKNPIYRDAYPTMFVFLILYLTLPLLEELTITLGLTKGVPVSWHFQNTSQKPNTKTLRTLPTAHFNLAMTQKIIILTGCLSVRNVCCSSKTMWLALTQDDHAGWTPASILSIKILPTALKL